MNMKVEHSKQSGAALIVALVALLILTVLGVSTMSDVLNQSSVVRNEQFRQKVFYAVSSEINVQIDDVNGNPQSEDDRIINDLLKTGSNGRDLELEIEGDEFPVIMTDPEEVELTDAAITGERRPAGYCAGESIGVNVIAGEITTTGALDGGGSIESSQIQRYTYCWP